MGYCGCMGYEALFPANQLGGLKNVWNLREYGVCEPWVMRESTVPHLSHHRLSPQVQVACCTSFGCRLDSYHTEASLPCFAC